MPYSDFTLDSLKHRFEITIELVSGLFGDIPSSPVGDRLRAALDEGLPLAISQNTEKARSELIVAPVFLHLWQTMERRISVFSGVEFNVERKSGLSGYCDFLVSRSPNALSVDAPVLVLVEAKKEDLIVGIPQCVAEMVAAQRFNEHRKRPMNTIYGCVTSGTNWRFLQLRDKTATVDLSEFYIDDVEQIFGILLHMMRPEETD